MTMFFFVLFFFVHEGRKNQIPLYAGPSSAHLQNAINWCFAGGPMMAQILNYGFATL